MYDHDIAIWERSARDHPPHPKVSVNSRSLLPFSFSFRTSTGFCHHPLQPTPTSFSFSCHSFQHNARSHLSPPSSPHPSLPFSPFWIRCSPWCLSGDAINRTVSTSEGAFSETLPLHNNSSTANYVDGVRSTNPRKVSWVLGNVVTLPCYQQG